MKVNKDFYTLGLKPIELLVYCQVVEFNTNTGDCFISDKVMADNFNVSEKTVSRALEALELKGLIRRETKNIKGGKERHIYTK
jgi:predicted transcriptional regulator